MDFDSIYNNLFNQDGATATKEAAATQQNTDQPTEKKAGMSKLAEDAETLYAAGQIFGMGYIQGAVKEAAEMGDIGQVEAIATEWRSRSDGLVDICNQFQKLAEDFDFDGIIKLVGELET